MLTLEFKWQLFYMQGAISVIQPTASKHKGCIHVCSLQYTVHCSGWL